MRPSDHRPRPRRSTRQAELGQNFLRRRSTIRSIVALATADLGLPLLEFGAGDGALTGPLVAAGAQLTAVELDPWLARRLRRRYGAKATVVEADLLDYPLAEPCQVVSNVPFHLSTALLRKLLANDRWSKAVLLLQWEVARRRAGVGGATMMTAAWWPWYDFRLVERVPAEAFRPVPSVDGGILLIERRARSLLSRGERGAYQELVGRVFRGRGRDLRDVVGRIVGRRMAGAWMRANGLAPGLLPRGVKAAQWVDLYLRWIGRAG